MLNDRSYVGHICKSEDIYDVALVKDIVDTSQVRDRPARFGALSSREATTISSRLLLPPSSSATPEDVTFLFPLKSFKLKQKSPVLPPVSPFHVRKHVQTFR